MLGTTILITNSVVPLMGGNRVSLLHLSTFGLKWMLMVYCAELILLLHWTFISFFCSLYWGDKARVIQGMLFMSGINTLIQTLIGSRLPVVMGPSYVYLIPIMSIISSNNTGNYDSEHHVGSYEPLFLFFISCFYI